MKTMKRALAMLMAAFIIAGIFAPVSPQAATKPTVSFYGWAKEDQSQCYLKVKNAGSDGYYYRIYVNGKLYKANGKSVLNNRSICKVCGIPKNTVVTVSVKGVKQSTWSSRYVIVPVLIDGKTLKISFPSNSKKAKFSWTKIKGATDYVVQISKNPSKGWTKVATTKNNYATISKFQGSAFGTYTDYYYRVVPRRKVGSKYYGSKFPKTSWYAGKFWFTVTYK